ncbi:MAG TPA: DUF6544 family protein [Pyrinomonadaceae bacterium]|nr:DUF6544 family protein [Pyrinomonadaceae bacterium]
MSERLSLDSFWHSAPSADTVFSSALIANLPDVAKRYLTHTIAPGTLLARAVRLRMHGEIKLKAWAPFQAEEVIRSDRGLIWQAAVRMKGLPVRGYDRYVDGAGEMRWKLLGIVPVVKASGADVTRSAAGRFAAESIWLPSLLVSPDVSWAAGDSNVARVALNVGGQVAEMDFVIEESGRLRSMSMQRWGNPEGGEFHWASFGAIVEDEATFSGYTIPTRLRIGWFFGSERFEREGEFFRCTIDDVAFR